MREIARFLFSVFAGLLLHQTSSITNKMPHGWQQLVNYTIGSMGVITFIMMWNKRYAGIKDEDARITAAATTGFLGIGSGVAFGWLMDTLFRIDRNE